MKKIVMLCMFWLLLIGVSYGKAVEGIVFDNENNQAIVGVSVTNERTKVQVSTNMKGEFRLDAEKGDLLSFRAIGFEAKTIKVKLGSPLKIVLEAQRNRVEELISTTNNLSSKRALTRNVAAIGGIPNGIRISPHMLTSTESYAQIKENKFLNPKKEPLSTFSADVDAASYANVRRMLNLGTLPPKDAVRIEEMINYFQYDQSGPTNGDPVRISSELSVAPWNTAHRLLRISLKAKDIDKDLLPASNFVFLIDVSGSMYAYNKLPLVKSSLKMLVDQLRSKDRVAIITYAGSAAVKLESTAGDQKMKIKDVIDELEAGGSTAGADGIIKAYTIAKTNFIKGGNNRIIMATDGDFNVGPSNEDDLESLIAKERESGINISLLGFGMGNYKDSKMEILADKGRGNYAYIDHISEARKAIITEFGATLFTVAKDVKIQVEFNPAHVQAYRLVGYENRLLEAEDFNNDAKIGGDMGVGHTVTAFYEIVPTGVKSSVIGSVDDLKYQTTGGKERRDEKGTTTAAAGELATVKFRYKDPHTEVSKMKQIIVENSSLKELEKTSADFRFASTVAEFGLLLRHSDYKQKASFDALIARAKAAKGQDSEGYRAEFIRLAQDAKALSQAVEQ